VLFWTSVHPWNCLAVPSLNDTDFATGLVISHKL
jgi:hypothetical protein